MKERIIFMQVPVQSEKQYSEHILRQRINAGYSYPVTSERGIENIWLYDSSKHSLEVLANGAAEHIASEYRNIQSLSTFTKFALKKYIAQKVEEVGGSRLVEALKKYLYCKELIELGNRFPSIQRYIEC